MRSAIKRWAMGLMGVGLFWLLQGCQANGGNPQPAASAQGPACSTCQVARVNVPVDAGKGRIGGYTSKKEMSCPDCRGAVDSFVTSGKLEHTCKRCASTMETCEAH